jgi:starch-binding outer membrane protein, SusD/RagB family
MNMKTLSNIKQQVLSRLGNRLTRLMLVLLFISAITGSCSDDYLYLSNPNSVTTESFYKTQAQAIMAVNAAYTSLQKEGMYGRLMAFTQIGRSDEGYPTVWILGSGGIQHIVKFNTIATNEHLQGHWRDFYNGIFRSNVVLERIPAIEMSQELKTRMLGEAHFLRAFYYFHLVTMFGEEVPLVIETPKSSSDYFVAAAQPGQVWDLIVSDLEFAKTALWTQERYATIGELGRASSGAAAAMLGKTHLFRATMDSRVKTGALNSANLYNLAQQELLAVVNGQYGTYRLMTGPNGYRNNFLEYDVADGTTLVEYNDESIFEIGFANLPGAFFSFVNEDHIESSEANGYSQEFGIGRGAGSGRWHNMGATKMVHGQFEPEDPRRILTFWTPDGATYTRLNGQKFTYNQINDWLDIQGNPVYYGWRKYEYDVEFRSLEMYNYSPINFRYMRYSDVLLMLAETYIMTSSADVFNSEAAVYIDMVRDRARAQDVANANGFVNQLNLPTTQELFNKLPYTLPNGRILSNMMDILMHERLVEFAGECHRWNDIVRWNIGNEALAGIRDKESFRGEIDYVLPIPQAELDANPNAKPNIRN